MRKEIIKANGIACAVLVLLLIPALCQGGRGKVLRLEDGDSGLAFYQGKEVEFRLYGIDAPEHRQDFGDRAKDFSSKMMLGKTVEIEILDHDRYNREVALIFVDGRCVNEELVKTGLAWVYTQYCKIGRCDEWLKLQQAAKEKRLGLWAKRNPVPPWRYRMQKHSLHPSSGSNFLTRFFASYRGNESSRVFHRKGCRYYNCDGCTATFSSRGEAIRKGFTPCRICKP